MVITQCREGTMTDSKASLGPLETDILRYIGDHYPITVTEVVAYIAETSGQARTTVLTVMDRLRRKGHDCTGFLEAPRRRQIRHPEEPQPGPDFQWQVPQVSP